MSRVSALKATAASPEASQLPDPNPGNVMRYFWAFCDFVFGFRHTDWRVTVDFRWRRWNGSQWEYRDMTDDEQLIEAQHRSW